MLPPGVFMAAILQRLLLLLVTLVAAALLLLVAWHFTLRHLGGAWHHAPEDARWLLSARARTLAAAALKGPEGDGVVDDRIAVISRGQLSGPQFTNHSRERPASGSAGGPLAWLHERLRDNAAGIEDADKADAEYVSRLLRQIRAMPGDYRGRILARDRVFGSDGQRDPAITRDYVANDYVVWLAGQAPKHLAPVVSIHPDRADAAEQLKHWAKAGVTRVSWWPIAQQIDLNSVKTKALYAIMAAQHMTLQIVVGEQTAGDRHGWTPPDAIRPALAAGVRVELTLAGARGDEGRRLMPALFALLRDPAYQKTLSVDLDGVLTGSRPITELVPLLQHPQFFARLHYASGYPEPVIASAVNLERLAAEGLINPGQVRPLQAIYDVNPLLFVLVTLRNVHLPATRLKLPPAVFFEPSKAWQGSVAAGPSK